jgi:hypothetical protein
MTMSAATSALSDYEVRIAQNIERNNTRLRELGLISKQEESWSNLMAWKKNVPAGKAPAHQSLLKRRHAKDDEEYHDDKDDGSESDDFVPKRTKHVKAEAIGSPVSRRQSRRLAGNDPEIADISRPSPQRTKTVHVKHEDDYDELRVARLQRAIDVSLEPEAMENAAKRNKTATYQHCLMRIRTMPLHLLPRRIQSIERAAGKDCVIKMAIFKCCLQDYGYTDLAEQASEALERLKGLQPPPPTKSEREST